MPDTGPTAMDVPRMEPSDADMVAHLDRTTSVAPIDGPGWERGRLLPQPRLPARRSRAPQRFAEEPEDIHLVGPLDA